VVVIMNLVLLFEYRDDIFIGREVTSSTPLYVFIIKSLFTYKEDVRVGWRGLE